MTHKIILIVDNNGADAQELSGKLLAEGYDVVVAADGPEAVGALRAHRIAMLVMNTSLPPDVGHGGGAAWDGFTLLDWLRRIETPQAIKVVLITADNAAKHASRARAAGAIGLFQKPLAYGPLLGLIHQTLGGQPLPASAPAWSAD